MTFTNRIPVWQFLLCIVVFSINVSPATAEESHYDRVNLSADASEEIENDTLVAVLYTQSEGHQLAALSNQVNETMTQSIKLCKKYKDVDVQTLAYQTYPVYKKQHIVGWRVRQSLRLKSMDISGMSKLISELQNNLGVESMHYTVSRQLREKMETQLIGQAIKAFQTRADNIARHLGHKKFRLVQMDVRTQDTRPHQMDMRTTARVLESSVATPAIEPGKQTMSVTVSGTIELTVN